MAGFRRQAVLQSPRMRAFAQASQSLRLSDAFKSSLVLFVPGTGSEGGTTFTDLAKGKTNTRTGSPITTTSQSPYAESGSCISLSGTSYFNYASDADFGFGNSDFAVACMLRPNMPGADLCLFDTRTASNEGIAIYASLSGAAQKISCYNNSALMLSATVAYLNLTWNEIVISRTSNALRIGLNGANVGSGPVTDSRTYASASSLYVGSNYLGSQIVTCHIGYIRVYKGAHPWQSSSYFPPNLYPPQYA